MTDKIDNGGPAFPMIGEGPNAPHFAEGMSLRDWFAGQALANAALCTGLAKDYELRDWFGGRGGITRAEVIAKQAGIYADAMIAERNKKP